MTKRTPLKRHKALVALSKDHHFGLLLCWKLHKGQAGGVSSKRIKEYLLYFFNEHLRAHFLVEEKIIFPVLPVEHPLRLEAERQHRELYQLIAQLEEDQEELAENIKKFEEQLEKHIRFEERQLFMEIQEQLNEKELTILGEQVEDAHTAKQEQWEDRFWE